MNNKVVMTGLVVLALGGVGVATLMNRGQAPAPAPDETPVRTDAPTELAVKAGEAAPAWTLKDTSGKEHSLADFKGKYVVLEWLNYGCPFVKKHYGSGNMQKLQAAAKDQGVVWLSINSSAPGKQGHSTPEQADELSKKNSAVPTAVLLDSDGTLGKAYAAKTTPHMYVIAPDGKLIYNGAIDDNPSADPKDVEGAKNYVLAALKEHKESGKVTTATTQPYGCSVKY